MLLIYKAITEFPLFVIVAKLQIKLETLSFDCNWESNVNDIQSLNTSCSQLQLLMRHNIHSICCVVFMSLLMSWHIVFTTYYVSSE